MRVLSIDGGGIRGIIPALVLAELEARAGKSVAQLFDLIAGTSTGGILACALAVPDARPAAEVVDLYRTQGPGIFRRSLGQRIRSADGLLDEKHDHRALQVALADYLGGAQLSDATTQLLITAYDLEAREPYFFKSWRPDREAPMTTVALATASAPTYFEPVAFGDLALVDGGVCANNPGMCAYAEVRRLTGDDPELLVSLGTGRQTKPIHFQDAKGWGLIEWVRPVIDVVFDGVGDTVEYQLDHILGPDVHRRLQLELTDASDALDDASPRNISRLEAHARKLIADRSDELDAVVRRLLAPA